MIQTPGLYPDYPEEDYHLDPCPTPSLSRSIAKILAAKTPRHAFIAHPRLDPDFAKKPSKDIFDLGTACHTALLKRGQGIVSAPFDDWRTNASKEFREQARARGVVPLLGDQYDRVQAMRQAILDQLPDHGLSHLFDPSQGAPEVVAACVDPTAGWCRIMIDWLTHDMEIWDFKSTDVNLDEGTIGRHMSSQQLEFQHAFYERVIVNLYPEMEGRVKFRFLFAEVKPPFQIFPVELPADALAKGRAGVEKGARIWAECMKSGNWPITTRPGVQTVEYPPWSTAEFVNAEKEG